LFFAKYSIDAIAYLLLCFLVLTLKKVSQLEYNIKKALDEKRGAVE